tara:strand:- start:247 stop:609 length:363 start_codon:yes stop_codon:yes gene_type:complete
MANKYHRQGFRAAGVVLSKLAKKQGKTDFEKFYENIFTKDKTGNKDKMIDALNRAIKGESKKKKKKGITPPDEGGTGSIKGGGEDAVRFYNRVMTGRIGGTKPQEMPSKEFIKKFLDKKK